jgi:alginate O-acetyltransferase complex protein AlgI
VIFASAIFLYWFLPVFLTVYYVIPKAARSAWITVASFFFYGWWRPDFVLLMVLSTALDYTAGARITRAQERGETGKPWLWFSCVANLSLLGYFKYANFGVETLNAALVALGHTRIEWTSVVLPVGISFYTFQTLSYTIDVYRKDAPAARNIIDFACFVSMFPQLVAGPIVRYNTVAKQLVERTHTLSKFWRGVLYFQAGLAKKILIADLLAPVADDTFRTGGLGAADAWLGTLAYTFQIYFDFSGYSDMAIGLGLMLGFAFPVNFDQPYVSRSITEFWRRWHISLSTFLRDYLYIPLGGNRRGRVRTYVNLAATMLLGGLWHGAAWTFIAWGAYQGFWMIVERLSGKSSLYSWAPKPAQMALTFVLAMFGWVLFRASTMGGALHHFEAMFGLAGDDVTRQLFVAPLRWAAFAIAAIVVWGFPTTQAQVHAAKPGWVLSLQPLFVLALVHLHYENDVPFLYFQF